MLVIASVSEAIQGRLAQRAGLLRRFARNDEDPHPPPRVARGRGTMRSMVEGACGAEADREARAPSTALRAVPLPRFAGQDDVVSA